MFRKSLRPVESSGAVPDNLTLVYSSSPPQPIISSITMEGLVHPDSDPLYATSRLTMQSRLSASEQREFASRMERKQLKEFMTVRSLPYHSSAFESIPSPPFHNHNHYPRIIITTHQTHRQVSLPPTYPPRCTPSSCSAASTTASTTSPPSPWSTARRAA